jgi:hypothetical protein
MRLFKISLFSLLPLLSLGQLNIKDFGASESSADNAKYIQKAIDSSVKTGKYVYVPIGKWRSGPLIVSKWNGTDYSFVTVKIIGESTFWDTGNGSVLISLDPFSPSLSVQRGKGCIVDGIQFTGLWKAPGSPYKKDIRTYIDPNTRDSRYSPYCAIAIDPFYSIIPPDGGYPNLKVWYRGGTSRGGSTGIIIKNCIFRGFTVGAITSPNGYTLNAELITFENIQVTDCKIGISGCQAQEKVNRIINMAAWGTTHTVLAWNLYGQQQPGNWSVSWLNVAGDVNQVIYRNSGGFFPLFMDHIYAENVFQFGFWHTFVGDVMREFVIDFKYSEEVGELPFAQFDGGGVSLRDGLTRYYGTDAPIIFSGRKKNEKTIWNLDHIKITESLGVPPKMAQTYSYNLPDDITEADCFHAEVKNGQIVNNTRSGKLAIFLDNSNTYLGYAIMNGTRIKYKSVTIKDGQNYKVAIK